MTQHRKTQRQMTVHRMTERRMTEHQMTEHRKTISWKILNTKWPNAELDQTSKITWIFDTIKYLRIIIIIYSKQCVQNFPAAASYYDFTN